MEKQISICRKDQSGDISRTVTAVRIDSLEQPQHNPNVDRDDVQVRGEEAVDERTKDRASPKDENLSGVSVLGG